MKQQVRVRRLTTYIAALAMALSLPLLALCVVLAHRWIGAEQAHLEDVTVKALDGVMARLDRYADARMVMLQTLATSPALDDGDFERLDGQARVLLPLRDANIVLRELDGRQRVNTRLPRGTPLPEPSSVDTDDVLRAKQTGVSNLLHGIGPGKTLIRVVVPVIRNGEVKYTLTSRILPSALEQLIRDAGIARPYTASLLDRSGLILARSERSAEFVGTPFDGFARALGDRGMWSGRNPEGVEVVAAYGRSRLSGWLLTVEVEKAALDGSFYRSLWTLGLIAAGLCLVALVASISIVRRLVSSHHQIARAARLVGEDRVVPAPRTPILEVNLIGEARADTSARLREKSRALSLANEELERRVAERTAEVTTQASLLQATLNNMDQGLILIAADGTIPLSNPRAHELLGLPPGFIGGGRTFGDVVRYQLERDEFASLEATQTKDWVLSGGLGHMRQNYERQRPDGSTLEVRTVPLAAGGAVRTFTDITETRRRERALREAESEYRQLFENAVVGIYRSHPDGRTLRANPALVRLNGFETEADLLAASDDLSSDWYVDPERRGEFLELLRREGRVTAFESEVYRLATRERIWVTEAAWTVEGPNGVRWFEGTVYDSTDRKRAEAETRHIASHDGLTGLLNRTRFRSRLEELLADEGAPPLALLALDLDRFKTVNDTLGHAAGDALLQEVARHIQDVLSPDDIAARLSGDEFAIIQRAGPQPGAAEALAATLLDLVARRFDLDGRYVTVGVSIGIAVPTPGQGGAELFAQADIALYEAKNRGRNTFQTFAPAMAIEHQRRHALELDLSGACERDEFFLEYQPSVHAGSLHVHGFEALIRWHHPVRGICGPGSFIPAAERTGLIVGIGDWVLRTACREAARWTFPATVSVNVSAVQFAFGDVERSVIAALSASGLAPERLELEVTESVLIQNSEAVIDLLHRLRAFGVRIALDDFGTGFSSLSYLSRFRFDRVKIDRSFVRDIANPQTLDIVQAIVLLARRRAIEVTAEGVETPEQLEIVRAEGCTHIQGYLFSKPMPAAGIPAFLARDEARERAA